MPCEVLGPPRRNGRACLRAARFRVSNTRKSRQPKSPISSSGLGQPRQKKKKPNRTLTLIAPVLIAFWTSLRSSIPAASMTCLTASRADASRLPNPFAERIDSSICALCCCAMSSSSRPKYMLHTGDVTIRQQVGRVEEEERIANWRGTGPTCSRWRSRPGSLASAPAPRARRWRRTIPSGGTYQTRSPFGSQTSCAHSRSPLRGCGNRGFGSQVSSRLAAHRFGSISSTLKTRRKKGKKRPRRLTRFDIATRGAFGRLLPRRGLLGGLFAPDAHHLPESEFPDSHPESVHVAAVLLGFERGGLRREARRRSSRLAAARAACTRRRRSSRRAARRRAAVPRGGLLFLLLAAVVPQPLDPFLLFARFPFRLFKVDRGALLDAQFARSAKLANSHRTCCWGGPSGGAGR